MIFNMVGGGGGSGVSVSVVSYLSRDNLPVSAKEGTIAVITDKSITDYVFSYTAPVVKNIGTVWMTSSDQGVPYTVDKKGIVCLNLGQCSIWDGNIWLFCDAYVYKYGEWVYFSSAIPVYFDNGDTCDALTGGWTKEGYTLDDGSGNPENTNAEIAEGLIKVENDRNYSSAIIGTVEPVDLTSVDTLYFEVADCNDISYSILGVTRYKDKCGNVTDKTYEDCVVARPITTGASTVELNVSLLTGEYYIYVLARRYDYGYKYTHVSKISGGIDAAGTVRSLEAKIAIGNTYRYGAQLQAGDWKKLSTFNEQDLKVENYVGQGKPVNGFEDYNAMMIPVPAFTYNGTFKCLKMSPHLWVSDKDNHTFHWAVSTTANADVYKTAIGAVTEEGQLGHGTFTPDYNNSAAAYQTFTLDCSAISSGTPFYIYLWRENTNYGNIHVTQYVVVTLEYAKT